MSDDNRTFGSTDTAIEELSLVDNSTSIYDALRADLTTDIAIDPIPLIVPLRPTIEILYKPEIEWDLFESWMKRAAKNPKKTVNPVNLALSVLSFTCVGIRRGGKNVVDDEGDNATFASEDIQKMLKANSVQQAIRAMYGQEGHIISTSARVLEEAGYGDVDIESGENPLE